MSRCEKDLYNEDRQCPACDARAKEIGSQFDFGTGHIARTCRRCHYKWLEGPQFSPEEPFITDLLIYRTRRPASDAHEGVMINPEISPVSPEE